MGRSSPQNQGAQEADPISPNGRGQMSASMGGSGPADPNAGLTPATGGAPNGPSDSAAPPPPAPPPPPENVAGGDLNAGLMGVGMDARPTVDTYGLAPAPAAAATPIAAPSAGSDDDAIDAGTQSRFRHRFAL